MPFPAPAGPKIMITFLGQKVANLSSSSFGVSSEECSCTAPNAKIAAAHRIYELFDSDLNVILANEDERRKDDLEEDSSLR